jgi:sugar phosphate isomerase/epimerase
MKISVSSYSFQRYLNEGRMNIFDLIKTTAEIGFDGIEFSGLKLPEGETDTAALAAGVKDACAEAGLPIISYTIGADFINPPQGGSWQDEVERLKGEVDIAAALGAPRMRHDATGGIKDGNKDLAEFLEVLPVVAGGCRAITEYAADKGIRTMVENHGFLVQDSDRCAVLFDEVNHPNFGWLVDIGNFLCADDDPLRAVTRMAPHAIHAHAKDFHIKPSTADPGDGWFRSLVFRQQGQHGFTAIALNKKIVIGISWHIRRRTTMQGHRASRPIRLYNLSRLNRLQTIAPRNLYRMLTRPGKPYAFTYIRHSYLPLLPAPQHT